MPAAAAAGARSRQQQTHALTCAPTRPPPLFPPTYTIPPLTPQHTPVRDYRRENKYTARTVVVGKGSPPLDVAAMVARLPLTPEDVKYEPRPASGLLKDRGV